MEIIVYSNCDDYLPLRVFHMISLAVTVIECGILTTVDTSNCVLCIEIHVF